MIEKNSYAYNVAPNQFVESNGRRLAYRSVGEGKPIVLCARFRGNLDSWDPAFIDALVDQGFRVITFDYSGLGLSGGTPTYSPLALAEDARDLIEALELKDAVLGGWSLGALTAQVVLAKYPQLITHAVLLGAVPPGPNVKGAEQLFNDTARKIENDLEDEIVLFFEPASPASRAAAHLSHERLALRKEGRSQDISHSFAVAFLPPEPRSPMFPADPILLALKHTQVPILHIGGDHDIAFPVENWYALNQQLPTVQLITFPQAGHGPHHQYPEAAALHIAAFVRLRR
ncbi:alpha/beta hydrolase [Variovorax sp. J2P1-59]|uniref:alpha/beta fold hydrolase n=1 Tax=Variovorax flavidus TaxID=3053501 RepID=UPI0025755634|nr:alpha/beta hydrolase [Variovorax sp. J2P1-59]MDM0078116.1 alpha/beta hydrolase [Variovorax sp. J2P1-59]